MQSLHFRTWELFPFVPLRNGNTNLSGQLVWAVLIIPLWHCIIFRPVTVGWAWAMPGTRLTRSLPCVDMVVMTSPYWYFSAVFTFKICRVCDFYEVCVQTFTATLRFPSSPHQLGNTLRSSLLVLHIFHCPQRSGSEVCAYICVCLTHVSWGSLLGSHTGSFNEVLM